MVVFILVCITVCAFQFCNQFEEEDRAGCFAFIVLRMYCYRKCSVTLPYGGVDWSEVCDYCDS